MDNCKGIIFKTFITGRPGLEKKPVSQIIILNKGGVAFKTIPPSGGHMTANNADTVSNERRI